MQKKILNVLLIVCCMFAQFLIVGCSDNSPKKEEADLDKPILETKETALKSITYAVINDRPELFWNCLAENTRTILLNAAQQIGKPADIVQKEVFYGFKKDFQKLMMKHENNPHKVVEALSEGDFFPMEEIEGKWYLLLDRAIARKADISKLRNAGKYSNKLVLANDFINGIIGGNYNLVWNCLSAKMRTDIKNRREYEDCNDDEIKMKFVNEMKPVIDKELEKHNYDAEKMISEFAKRSSFIKTENRWFYQE